MEGCARKEPVRTELDFDHVAVAVGTALRLTNLGGAGL